MQFTLNRHCHQDPRSCRAPGGPLSSVSSRDFGNQWRALLGPWNIPSFYPSFHPSFHAFLPSMPSFLPCLPSMPSFHAFLPCLPCLPCLGRCQRDEYADLKGSAEHAVKLVFYLGWFSPTHRLRFGQQKDGRKRPAVFRRWYPDPSGFRQLLTPGHVLEHRNPPYQPILVGCSHLNGGAPHRRQ